MKDVLKEATVLDSEGQIRRIPAGKLAMGYRTSVIKEAGYMVLEAVISLKKGDPDQIRETMKDLTQRRHQQTAAWNIQVQAALLSARKDILRQADHGQRPSGVHPWRSAGFRKALWLCDQYRGCYSQGCM